MDPLTITNIQTHGDMNDGYRSWASSCLDVQHNNNNNDDDNNEEENGNERMVQVLCQQAKHKFLNMHEGHDEELAQLSLALGPALKSDLSVSIVRALGTIRGALMGVSVSSKALKVETLDLLEGYLLAQCECESASSSSVSASVGPVDGAVSDIVISAVECVEALLLCCKSVMENLEIVEVLRIACDAVRGAGISSLMRVGRSACYSLLQKALDVFVHLKKNRNIDNTPSTDEEYLRSFASFCASSLMGEKDPRCLLSALQLLQQCLAQFPSRVIPHREFFERASIYYPISFYPPPNDPHKVTREDLQVCLRQVICAPSMPISLPFTLFIQHLFDEFDEDDGEDNEKSCDIKYEIIEDTTNLIKFDSVNTATDLQEGHPSLSRSDIDKFSSALIRAHEWSFEIAPSQHLEEKTNEGKEGSSSALRLSHKCLSVASQVSSMLDRKSDLWDAFCSSPIRVLSRRCGEMPESLRGRSSSRYLCALSCSSAAAHQRCVQELSPQLLNIIRSAATARSKWSRDTDFERVIAALISLKALMQLKTQNSVQFFPDSLVIYSDEAMPILIRIAMDINAQMENKIDHRLLDMAATSLDTIISIYEHVSDKSVIGSLSKCILNNICPARLVPLSLKKYFDANSRFLSYFVLKDNNDPISPALSCLLKSASVGSDVEVRYDVSTLVLCCRSSHDIASNIVYFFVRELTVKLTDWFKNPEDAKSLNCITSAKSLRNVVLNGGIHAADAWKLQSASSHIFKCVWTLLENKMLSESHRRFLKDISKLLESCYLIVSSKCRLHIIRQISPIIPPLSDTDYVRLQYSLPILAYCVSTSLSAADDGDAIVELHQMLPSLCEFSLNADVDKISRSSSSAIIHSIILGKDSLNLRVQKLTGESICPVVYESAIRQDLVTFEETLRVLAVIASACSRRGGQEFSSCSDEIIKFFISLICGGSGRLPCVKEEKVVSPQFGESDRSSLLAAKALGTILAVSFCVEDSRFWRQRILSISLSTLMEACALDKGRSPPISAFIAVSHFCCCFSINLLGRKRVSSLIDLLVRGLVLFSAAENENEDIVDEYFLLALSGLLKFFSWDTQMAVEQNGKNFVPILLHVISSHTATNASSVSITVLALECLCLLPNYISSHLKFETSVKIVTKLVALNVIGSKSRTVRKAASRTRNVWFGYGVDVSSEGPFGRTGDV